MKRISGVLTLSLIYVASLLGNNNLIRTSYIVVKIEGKITYTYKGKKRSLLVEDEFWDTDALQFSSKKDFIIVVDTRQEEPYVLKPKEDLRSYTIKPSKQRINRRRGKILNYLTLIQYLKVKDFIILDQQIEVEIGGNEFPMDDDHFFYLQYDWKGDASVPINKKLPFKDSILLFSKDAILTVDDQLIKGKDAYNFRLYYYDAAKEESLFIHPVNLFFPEEVLLKQEIGILIKTLDKNDKNLFGKIDAYIQEVYGNMDVPDLKNWLNTTFDLQL